VKGPARLQVGWNDRVQCPKVNKVMVTWKARLCYNSISSAHLLRAGGN